MLTSRLKELTKQNHQLLEKKLIAQMRTMEATSDYVRLLSAFYSYFGGLEVLMSRSLDVSVLPDVADRRKASALAADLRGLNAAVPELASEIDLPEIKNSSQALGALYVIEGSTLGGQIISQLIRKQLGLSNSLSFFEGYGANTLDMWQSFKAAIDNAAGLSEDQAVETANQTFMKFSDWLEQTS